MDSNTLHHSTRVLHIWTIQFLRLIPQFRTHARISERSSDRAQLALAQQTACTIQTGPSLQFSAAFRIEDAHDGCYECTDKGEAEQEAQDVAQERMTCATAPSVEVRECGKGPMRFLVLHSHGGSSQVRHFRDSRCVRWRRNAVSWRVAAQTRYVLWCWACFEENQNVAESGGWLCGGGRL